MTTQQPFQPRIIAAISIRMIKPLYWRAETSGNMAAAVEAYFAWRDADGRPPIGEHMNRLRAYILQWITSGAWDSNPAPGAKERLADLRAEALQVSNADDLAAWHERAIEAGLCPF